MSKLLDLAQKMASSLTISDAPKLEHLPELCLDRVLWNLSFEDLISASIANELLAASAFRVFTLQFKNDEIAYFKTGYEEYMFGFDQRNVQTIPNNMLAPTLQHFGSSIKKLIVQVENQSALDRIIDQCGSTLSELTILIDHADLELKQPFLNLKELNLIILAHNLTDSWKKINQHFPTVRSLRIKTHQKNFFYDDSLTEHIPNLDTFSHEKIQFPVTNRKEQIRMMLRFLNNNKQIKSLRLGDIPSEFNEIQQHIEWDKFMITDLDVSTDFEINFGMIQCLSNLRSLTVKCEGFEVTESWYISLPLLEKMTVWIHGYLGHQMNFGLDYLISKNVNLKKLDFHIVNAYPLDIPDLMHHISVLCNNLKQLEHVVFKMINKNHLYDSFDFTVRHGTVEMLERCTKLQSLTVDIQTDVDCGESSDYDEDMELFTNIFGIGQHYVDWHDTGNDNWTVDFFRQIDNDITDQTTVIYKNKLFLADE